MDNIASALSLSRPIVLQRKDLILLSVLKHLSDSAVVMGVVMAICVNFSISGKVPWRLFPVSIWINERVDFNPLNAALLYITISSIFSFYLQSVGKFAATMSSCLWGKSLLNPVNRSGSMSSKDRRCWAFPKWVFACSIIMSQQSAATLTLSDRRDRFLPGFTTAVVSGGGWAIFSVVSMSFRSAIDLEKLSRDCLVFRGSVFLFGACCIEHQHAWGMSGKMTKSQGKCHYPAVLTGHELAGLTHCQRNHHFQFCQSIPSKCLCFQKQCGWFGFWNSILFALLMESS